MKLTSIGAPIAAIVLAGALALGGATGAYAGSDSASDPTGDVDRQPGVGKNDTSDLNRVKLTVGSKRISIEARFENLRKGTVKLLRVGLMSDQYSGTDFTALMAPDSYEEQGISGDGLYFRDDDEQNRSAKGCSFDVDQNFGSNGTITLSFDRDCMKPNGGSKTTKGVELGFTAAGAQRGNGSVLWQDDFFKSLRAKV